MATEGTGWLKSQVGVHWEKEICGTRYSTANERRTFFDEISEARYRLEPYILQFADFQSAAGKTILEIGVGAGSDFENWCRYAAHATGIDLTNGAIALTKERLELTSTSREKYTLRTADAENLPFEDASFDLIYSWGVLHHTPDTSRALREVFRVLKPGGIVKTMIYHVPSWTGLMLYLQHGFARGRFKMTMKEAIFNHLESPGTKAYTIEEGRRLLDETGFSKINVTTRLCVGDFLAHKPSRKYDASFYKMVWLLYPRWVVRLLGDRYGLGLLITGYK